MQRTAPKLLILMNSLRSAFAWLLAFLAGSCFVIGAQAASVGPDGYTNDFSLQPSTGDWSQLAIGGAAGDVTDATGVDMQVQMIAASAITLQTVADVGNPPVLNSNVTWSSTGFYLQTRPTGDRVTLLMCTLVNNTGGAANALRISYDFTIAAPAGDEISGHSTYYSLTGAPGSWVLIPALSFANTSGRLTANLGITWPAAGTLYLLWADDNSAPSPDTANQIDNFSALVPIEMPVAITSQPVGQTVTELAPASFTVGTSGNPPPTYQWYRNNFPLPSETNATYSIASAPLNDNNAQFVVVAANTASNVNYSATSSPPAVLHVNADMIPPTLSRAIGVPSTTVSVDFSERIRADTANIAANYAITSSIGNLTISSAILSANGSNVVLTTSPQTLGTTYTLIVNGVRDMSAASNQIAPNSVISFTILSFVLMDVGGPQPAGSSTPSGNGFDLTAGGTGIDGVADSMAYDYQQRIGDFDVMVRVQGLSPADAFTKAGVMARESLAANSRYYASVATPGISGCFFQFRSATGGPTTNAGAAPTTYPNTFLRLKRAGNTLSGYFSTDGNTWMLLSSLANQVLPSQVYVGMFVASRINGTGATGQFRDFSDVVGTPPVASLSFPREPIGPSSRKTSFAITEIMYHPRSLPSLQGRSLEFIEIFNSNPFPESLGRHRLSGSIDYTFPANTVVKGGGFVVVARDPALVMSYYGISGVLGPWDGTNQFNFSTNGLPGGEGTVRLRGPGDNIVLEVNYQGGPPYPVAADGAGHSLVLSRASYGEGDPRAWGISDVIDGSPGTDDPFGSDRLRNVVINEFLAHTDDPLVPDYVELYNHGNTAVDLSGAYLADEADFLSDAAVTNHFYRISNGISIPPRGFLSFNQNTLGFSLSASGERIFLVNSNKTRVIDAIAYEAQGNGVSMGRSPNGAAAWYRMASRTPGAANSAPRNDPIVINEIMFSPISGDANHEYLELYNRGGSPVNLGGWRFLNGINYTIPQGTVLTNGQYLVIAKNHTNLMARYPNLSSANTVGDFKGTLANGGERITLAMPELNVVTNNGVTVTNTIFVIVNEVTYGGGGGRWGEWADGGGSSLELRDPRSDNRQAANWADSDESSKGLWTTIAITNPIAEVLGPANDSLQIFLLGVGECLVDDVEVRNTPAGANLLPNPGFESDMAGWTPQGSHDHSTIEPVGFTGTKSLHLRAASRGDNGANRVRTPHAPNGFAASGTVVLRAKAKWIRGWPELLLRLHGGGLEVGGVLSIQPNLGTPGLPNSQLVANAGPALYEVIHSPILPAASEPVVVTARVTDPDGPITVRLKYRVEPATTHTAVTMVDDGTGADSIAGDGIYSATIPGQIAGNTVPFYVEAVDALNATNTFPTEVFPTPPMTRIFPNDATSQECVIRWGDRMMPGSLPTYHVWLNNGNTTRWTVRRPVLNNATVDSTFVYNNYRVIYNMRPLYAGSPWHRGQMVTGPAGANLVDYDIGFPSDDKFLGAGDAVWNNPGNPSGGSTSDNSAQSEQTTYFLFRELGIHYNYRRYVHIFVNGSQRSINGNRPNSNFIMEDSQQANSDIIDEWSPGETDGQLFKIEDWFEFPENGDDFNGTGGGGNNDADFTRRVIPGTTNIHIGAYRFMFRNRARGAGESANDYTNFVNLLNIITPGGATDPLTNLVQFLSLADVEQWMRIFACQHAAGNWDSFGFQRGKNAYMYKPKNGKFHQWTWDIDFTMGIGGRDVGNAIFDNDNGSPDGDERMAAMWNNPTIRRMYLRAFEDIVNGPLNNAFLDPILDAKSAALVANNVNPDITGTAAGVQRIKDYTLGRRNSILTQLGSTVANFFTASVGGQTNFTTNANLITVSGTAPVGARYIYINGIDVPVTWTSVSNWTARVALSNGVNNLTVQGYTSRGTPTNTASTITVNYTGPSANPVGSVVFNEILYNPVVPESSFVELFNNSPTVAFNIGGWEINGLDYSFPSNTVIGPRQYLVLPKNISAFSSAFGFLVIPIDDFDGDLDRDGETLTLRIPATTSSPAVVIDKVRYENQAPWPTIAPESGFSLQLIDAQQDNSRVSNWTLQEGQWIFATYTGRIATNGTNFLIFMQGSAGDVYIDDITLVTGAVAGVGMNLLQNGGFEGPYSETWTNLGNHTNSVVSTEFAHSGSSSLHVIATGPGGATACIRQTIGTFPTNTLCTVSFFFLPTTNGTLLTVRTTQGSEFNTNHLIRVALTPSSPGAANVVASTLPPYDPVWLNELQAENISGITDNMGEREPWIELYNAGPGIVDMSNYFLANNYGSNLTQWQFPAGYHLAPGELRIVWADGEPLETSGTNAHTNFRLPIGSGTLALVRLLDGQPQITDYLTYNNLRANLSYGDYPDGQPFTRVVFQASTPRGTNNTRDINVFINEWMAANASFLLDTSDNNYDDWFELYNAGPNAVDLGNYYLTDTLADPKKFRVPNNGQYVIPAGGYMLVWADNDSSANSPLLADLHANFSLSAGFPGEALGLFSPDGITPIDTVTFGQQTNNISEGRYADGAATRYWMMTPTPRSANVISGGNTPPVLTAIPDHIIRLGQTVSFQAMATDGDLPPQTLTFTLGGTPPLGAMITSGGHFTWTPSPAQTPGSYNITVVVTDNGPGALSNMDTFSVEVRPPPVAMVSGSDGMSISISFDTIPGRSYRVDYKTHINDPAWLPLNAPIVAPGTSMEITDNFGGEPQRFYKVFQVD
jgi:hypothetical protein